MRASPQVVPDADATASSRSRTVAPSTPVAVRVPTGGPSTSSRGGISGSGVRRSRQKARSASCSGPERYSASAATSSAKSPKGLGRSAPPVVSAVYRAATRRESIAAEYPSNTRWWPSWVYQTSRSESTSTRCANRSRSTMPRQCSAIRFRSAVTARSAAARGSGSARRSVTAGGAVGTSAIVCTGPPAVSCTRARRLSASSTVAAIARPRAGMSTGPSPAISITSPTT